MGGWKQSVFRWRADGRVLILFGFLVSAVLLVGVNEMAGYDSTQKVLHAWGVPALDAPFLDLRGVVAWIDLEKAGLDSRIHTSSIEIPSGAAVSSFLRNYPPVVLLLGRFGLSQSQVLLWGWLLAILYVFSIFLLVGKIDLTGTFLVGLYVFSPISILVMERANLDIFLFALLAFAVCFFRHPFLAVLPVLAAAALKLFPIVAVAAFLAKLEKRHFAAGVLGIAAFGAYLLVIREELGTITSGLTKHFSTCFGARVIPNLLRHHGLLPESTASALGLALMVLSAILAAGIFVAVFWLLSRSRRRQENLIPPMSERAEFGALMGLAIFCAMFFTGPQMDYKWIFLLLALPGVLEWRSSPGAAGRLAGLWLLSALVYSYWTFFSGENSLRNALLKQGVAWVLYAASCAVFSVMVARHLFNFWENSKQSREPVELTAPTAE